MSMTKEGLAAKLKELGKPVTKSNHYIKKTFLDSDDNPVVGLYKSELEEDFYFYIEYEKKIYMLPKQSDLSDFTQELFKGDMKYQVPLKLAKEIWEDKPYEELEDKPYNSMTLREYACIHLKTPESGLPWLDELIKKSIEVGEPVI